MTLQQAQEKLESGDDNCVAGCNLNLYLSIKGI